MVNVRSSDRVVYALVFSTLAVVLMFLVKPSIMFRPDGRPRPFGVGNDETMISVGLCTVAAAIASLYLFTWIDLVFV
jgi:hypothetical protein